MKRKLILAMAFIIATTVPVFGETKEILKGATSIQRTNTAYNTNPWNTDKIIGAGESGVLSLLVEAGKLDIPISAPLYSLNEYYTDKVVIKDGVWGIERRVEVLIFDGEENWELYDKRIFNNDSTVIFSATIDKKASIRNGISTHFDVHTVQSQKTNIYDGISFGEENNQILMRFMNVRNVNTVEGIKEYLKTQKNNGNPVKLFTAMEKSTFEPFAEEFQGVLNGKLNGYGSMNISYENSGITGGIETAIANVQIYEENKGYYIEGKYPTEEGIKIVVKNNENQTLEGIVLYKESDFLTTKATEIICRGENGEFVKLYINLRKLSVEKENTKINLGEEYFVSREMVIPAEIVVAKGSVIDFNNSILYGKGNESLNILKDEEVISTNGKITATENMEISIVLDEEIVTTKIIVTEGEIKEPTTVLFLGDSLINQDYYPQFFNEKYEDDGITLIGTRGTESGKHEGRGGWSVYDYRSVETKYGYTNPFLNNGAFDFSYYMNNNGYEKVDYIIMSLGINDTNLLEHNTIEEIIANLDALIDSIEIYNPNIKIMLNGLAVPFDEVKNIDAKNKRLEVTKALYNYYENSNLTVLPSYITLDGYNDFKFVEPVINEENQNTAMYVADATHPNVWGYKNIAETAYANVFYQLNR
ncbi:MAG: SGNH/GDSL hydrolase family protein [Anaerotignaceae bacterium]